MIGVPSPRDIPEVIQAIKALPYDKYWAKYFNEEEAYHDIRRFFLEHTEYTHLCIIPDDLTVTAAQIEKLLEGDYPVISGVCMINRGKTYENQLAVSVWPEPQSYIRSERQYHFMTKTEYDKHPKVTTAVTFQGFAPVIIEREVIEHIPFRDDRGPNNLTRGCCVDMMFGNDCLAAGIPLHVDLSVFTDHYFLDRRQGARTYCFGTGTHKPRVIYEKDGIENISYVEYGRAGVCL